MARKTRRVRERPTWYGQRRIRSASEFSGFFQRYFPGDHWRFRGMPNASWHLISSLDRYCRDYKFGIRDKPEVEYQLLLDFHRHMAIHTLGTPSTTDPQQLLALMQHHGTPTRLLDWSYSPFIATYFAVETPNRPVAVWALNNEWAEKQAERAVRKTAPHLPSPREYDERRDAYTFVKLFMPHLLSTPAKAGTFVYTVNPCVMNTRLSLQQGLFTAPGDVSKSFERNLTALPGTRSNVIKILIDAPVAREILSVLHRMGISRASLYPGLDGFAWSLRTKWHALRKIRSKMKPWRY